jgi:hypothetical protein
MADELEDAGLRLAVAAELGKRYAEDQRGFLGLLATLLSGALPDETTVERRGSFLGKKTVRLVAVELGGFRYTLEDPGRGGLRAGRVHVVRGIALKNEELSVEEWTAELSAALDERARSSEAARAALARLVE